MKSLAIIGLLLGAFVGTAASAACVEGRRQAFLEHDYNTDRSYTVIRTCVNGSFMTDAERAAYVRNPDMKCKEGNTAIWWETDYSTDNQVSVRVVCQGGKWKRLN